MDYLFEPHSALLQFLNPLELLKLLHVSRAARKAAVPYLKAAACGETATETRVHADRFRQWLTTAPIVATGSMVFHEEMNAANVDDGDDDDDNLAGPLRIGAIEKMSSSLVNRFVVLEYKKLGYQREHGKVAVFNEQGQFVAYYELESKQFYESFVDKEVHGSRGFNSAGGSNHSTAEIQIRNCGGGDDWNLRDQSLEWAWQEGFVGEVTSSNYDLFESFFGQLSPTEVSFILMHALSEDTRVIFQYVETVFDCFSREFEWIEDGDDDQHRDFMMEWKERLAALSYQERRPHLRFEVGTEVLCHVKKSEWQGVSQDQWFPGRVVEHWHRQPKDGVVVAYRVELDPRCLWGTCISVLTDTESEIKLLQRPRLRFPIGTEVLCLVDQNKWRPGRVTQHWYINQVACWNPHLYSRQERTIAPYRVKLDAGPDFSAPVDRDSVIRLKNNDSNPEGTSSILDSAPDSKKKKKRKRGEMSAAETGNHKEKKKKDNPISPKRPAKAFVSWSIQNRERVKLANPDIHEDDIGKLLRSQWKQLLEEEKKPFEDNYQAEKEWYKKERADYKLEKG